MRGVKRGAKLAPAALSKKNGAGKTELERARSHMLEPLAPNAEREAFKFAVYKEIEVKNRLEELFYGKCAYCETSYASQAPVDVEHYRPKGNVEQETDHPGYWWLAMEWTNLLPSCIDCNRRRGQRTPRLTGNLDVLYRLMQSGKKDSFPIAGKRALTDGDSIDAEEAILLNPTRDDPSQHLSFYIGDGSLAGLVFPKQDASFEPLPEALPDAGEIVAHADAHGLSVRGAVSIQVFGLNRLGLVQSRAELLQRLRFLEYLAVRIGDAIQALEMSSVAADVAVVRAVIILHELHDRILDEMRRFAEPTAAYSVLAATYIDDFKQRLGA